MMRRIIKIIIISCSFLVISACAFLLYAAIVPSTWGWKVFSNHIPVQTLNRLELANSSFIGMSIEDVLPLISKSNYYFFISRECDNYEVFIISYPELTLTEERYALYYVAPYNSGSREEHFPTGYFVNRYGIVIERTERWIVW